MTAEFTTGQGNFEARKDALSSDFKDVARDTEKLMKDVSGATADSYAAARTTIEEKLGAAKSRLSDARIAAAERARTAAGATDAYVRENPWTVLGAAAAVGLAVGLLMHRR